MRWLTDARAATAKARRFASSPTRSSTRARSSSRSPGRYSQPVRLFCTRSSGPPRPVATTGTPLASASCTVWQNVSFSPGCTNRSKPATASARASPPRKPRKVASGSSPLERGAARPLPHDDQLRAREVGDRLEVLDLLLGGEAPDVADDRLPARRDGAAPVVASPRGVESLAVDPARPASEALDSEGRELRGRRRGGGERQGGPVVDAGDVPGERGRGHRNAVPRGIAGDVGLIDRDRRDAEVVRGSQRLPAEHERRREVDDVGAEVAQDRLETAGAREGEPHLGVVGKRHRPQEREARAVQAGGLRGAGGLRRDDERLVPARLEVTEHLQNGVDHAVHLRQEGLGDHHDSHDFRVTGRGHARRAIRAWPPRIHGPVAQRSLAAGSRVTTWEPRASSAPLLFTCARLQPQHG